MAITITTEEIEHKDPEYLRGRIASHVEEHKKSVNQSRGELLVEIQVLLNRIDSIHSERAERKSRRLEWIVILLIIIEVIFGGLDFFGAKDLRPSIDRNTAVLQRLERTLLK